jgi:hypothetical protein
VDDRLETPTWALMRSMGSDSNWSPEFKRAGRWGLDVLERWLGPDWPEVCYHRDGVPPELLESATGLRGLAMLIDLAASLELLGYQSGAGKVRRALRRNPNTETLAAVRCMLRFAMAGLRAGLTPIPEYGEPPIDLVLTNKELRLTAEIKTLRRPATTSAIDVWLQKLTWRLLPHFKEYDVVVEGDALEPVGEEETHDIAERIIDRMRLAAVGLQVPPVTQGSNQFIVRPSRAHEAEKRGTTIAIPPVDLWRRTAARIRAAARQTRESGAAWLVIESLDNFWQLTPWSQQPLATRASQLAGEARTAISEFPHLDGILFTDGAALTNVESPDADARPEPGVAGLRRRLDYVRSRETIVVATRSAASRGFDAWVNVIDSEPGFVQWALPGLGLDPPRELLPGHRPAKIDGPARSVAPPNLAVLSRGT